MPPMPAETFDRLAQSPGARAVASRVLEVLIAELVADGDAALNVAGAGLRSRTFLYVGPDGLPALELV